MGMIISKFSAASMGSSFICVTHLVKGTQFLIVRLVSAATVATFISPVARIYASE